MIELLQISIPVQKDQTKELSRAVRHLLRIPGSEEISFKVLKRSIDARKKPEVFFNYSVVVDLPSKQETEILKRTKKNGRIRKYQPVVYEPVKRRLGREIEKEKRPVVCGAGPAGLFAAYLLALNGFCPILIERGAPITERTRDVETFFQTGVLDPESNVQFGEGGAGAFSDGKLNTGVHDKEGRNAFVLRTFVRFGADPEILYDQKPHVGTDKLVTVVQNLRKEIESLGATVLFHTCLKDLKTKDGRLSSIIVKESVNNEGDGTTGFEEKEIPCDRLILALGHSARDTFSMLYRRQVPMHGKEFAVGFRIEHPQEWLDRQQYGMLHENLPPSSYSLSKTLPNGRGVYSFCMCPGGYVENSSSESNGLVVNGMSYSGRDSGNCNSAVIVSVGEKEYDLNDPMGAVRYQEGLEKKAFLLGKGKIPQQLLSDYEADRPSFDYGSFLTKTKGASVLTNLRGLFSKEIEDSFLSGLHFFDERIPGFFRKDAILSGVESRTSSPVRIDRSRDGQSAVRGIFPCGEGAGYAGGIMSAAMDGMKMAEKLMEYTENESK